MIKPGFLKKWKKKGNIFFCTGTLDFDWYQTVILYVFFYCRHIYCAKEIDLLDVWIMLCSLSIKASEQRYFCYRLVKCGTYHYKDSIPCIRVEYMFLFSFSCCERFVAVLLIKSPYNMYLHIVEITRYLYIHY